MLIELDMTSDKPIYIQLKEQIIEGIARQDLKPGDDLPSVRALASDIGINLHTVNKVYQQSFFCSLPDKYMLFPELSCRPF